MKGKSVNFPLMQMNASLKEILHPIVLLLYNLGTGTLANQK